MNERVPGQNNELLPKEKVMLDLWNHLGDRNLESKYTLNEIMEGFQNTARVIGKVTAPKKSTFKRVLEQLVRKGFAEKQDDTYSLTPSGIAVAEALRDDPSNSREVYERKPN